MLGNSDFLLTIGFLTILGLFGGGGFLINARIKQIKKMLKKLGEDE